MAKALILPAGGVVNGSNVSFTTPAPYVAGTLRVFLNGQVKRADFDDGWIETGATSFKMKIAPETGDVVSVYFVPL